MKKSSLIVLMSIFLLSFTFSMDDTRLLRFPDINKDIIAFVYAGDIWTVPAAGGDARRLTSHEGLELYPRISPDGKWIAFSAEYPGTRQVYVMPTSGGIPKQLTFYNDVGGMPPRGGVDNIPLDWTPDSTQILVRANRTPHGERMGRYFLVPVDGGFETPLQIPEAGFGTFSPDAKSIVYTPISREFRTWKRHKGGRAQDVWIYDLVNNKSERITDFPGTDQHPTWYKDKIYFVSDRSLTLNFWSYDLKTKALKQITDYTDYDVLWPAGHDGLIAYENGGYINVLDLNTEKTRKVTVNVNFDNPNRLPYFKNVKDFISRFGAGLSQDGKRAIFDARGDFFTVPAKEGVTVNLTRTQGIREMYPVWSPDGKWIAYISDQTGDYEIYLMDPKKPEKTIPLTTDHKVWKYPLQWSPDSKKLLFADMDRKVQVLDIDSKKITVIDKGDRSSINDYEWSWDSRWVAYSKEGENKLSSLWVYSLEKQEKHNLSSERYNDYSPAFSQCGKFIFFISDRDFDMSFRDGFSSMDFDFVYPKTSRMYALALTKDAPDLFKKENDLEEAPKTDGDKAKKEDKADKKKKDSQPGKEEKKEKVVKPVTIDFDGIRDRVQVFPLGTENYGGIRDLGEGKILYGKGPEVRLYDLKTQKDELVVTGARPAAFTADNKKMLYRAGGKWGIMEIKPGQKAGEGELNLNDVVMKIEPVKEWQQIYNEGWRIYRDWFYVRNMHGVDWRKMREKYAQLLPFLSHRADLDYIFGELMGELNIGHTYVNWGDFKRVERVEGGLLGAELKADGKAGRYMIAKIFKGENWNERTRSPLTEQGVDVKEGDYIIELNGFDVTTKENPYKFLENTAGKKITITVNSKPSAEGARTSWIKPIASELGLRYLDWVETRRQLVDKLSNGRIAYIHVPNTAVDGNRELFKGLYAFSYKDAFIIDDRYNGGGWSPVKMIEKLGSRPVSYWHRRDLALRQDPFYSLEGPMVMLINHYSSSGGDNFPYWFRKRGLGPLIGTRTWGGLVGYSWSPDLVDGPSFAVPMSGIVSLEGEFVVEGVGVYPDEGFEVYDLPEEIIKGNDPTIEAAVKYLLEQLEKHPPKKAKTPAEPDRSKWYEKEIK
jgi:tricorn protease